MLKRNKGFVTLDKETTIELEEIAKVCDGEMPIGLVDKNGKVDKVLDIKPCIYITMKNGNTLKSYNIAVGGVGSYKKWKNQLQKFGFLKEDRER